MDSQKRVRDSSRSRGVSTPPPPHQGRRSAHFARPLELSALTVFRPLELSALTVLREHFLVIKMFLIIGILNIN